LNLGSLDAGSTRRRHFWHIGELREKATHERNTV
jgi:hypothetical protein